ncbi:MAG: hypothetical protein HPKKFMNG_01615 [Planctomycetes bacterium]|nr:hypothetical protein [Planctomycetota bacterium]
MVAVFHQDALADVGLRPDGVGNPGRAGVAVHDGNHGAVAWDVNELVLVGTEQARAGICAQALALAIVCGHFLVIDFQRANEHPAVFDEDVAVGQAGRGHGEGHLAGLQEGEHLAAVAAAENDVLVDQRRSAAVTLEVRAGAILAGLGVHHVQQVVVVDKHHRLAVAGRRQADLLEAAGLAGARAGESPGVRAYAVGVGSERDAAQAVGVCGGYEHVAVIGRGVGAGEDVALIAALGHQAGELVTGARLPVKGLVGAVGVHEDDVVAGGQRVEGHALVDGRLPVQSEIDGVNRPHVVRFFVVVDDEDFRPHVVVNHVQLADHHRRGAANACEVIGLQAKGQLRQLRLVIAQGLPAGRVGLDAAADLGPGLGGSATGQSGQGQRGHTENAQAACQIEARRNASCALHEHLPLEGF